MRQKQASVTADISGLQQELKNNVILVSTVYNRLVEYPLGNHLLIVKVPV
jgi:hypothetical protein